MDTIDQHRAEILRNHLRDKSEVLHDLMRSHAPSASQRAAVSRRAVSLVSDIRASDRQGLMEVFLAEYGLSSKEGVALMCLAEALLRVPDAPSIDALIEDKIAPSAWGAHLGQSSSPLVNASTWALMLTGKVLQEGAGVAATLKSLVKRLGEPIIRLAVGRAMKEMGTQFVLAENIRDAVARGQKMESRGYTYSYDMLGEAALTAADAEAFTDAYTDAISALSGQCQSDDIRKNPGISVKLSALHPRYEVSQRARVMAELVPLTLRLAEQAKAAGMGFNIDAEEANRLDLSLDVIEAVLRSPTLAGWDGFGVVVQAYGKRAAPVIDWLHSLAHDLDRKIMVRLVKGAYWDTEIKLAQVEGLADFPVYTRKAATDVSYICCARKLLGLTDRLYPQFATHNAHTVSAILEMADDKSLFEFQRLHGMGENLHDIVLEQNGAACRIYAPVGPHRDLLAYLVRRLLENGANSSFVNQIVDETVPADRVAADPFDEVAPGQTNAAVIPPAGLFGAERPNSRGWDLHDNAEIAAINAARAPFSDHFWDVDPLIKRSPGSGPVHPVTNPAKAEDTVGTVSIATAEGVEAALGHATPWAASANVRADTLRRAASLFEEHHGEIFAALTREAGKTPMDAISELREAVDFLRYYAARGEELTASARGLIACISPWNFPFAIFTGQIAAALAAGNGVIAKPAEPTTIVAAIAVRLMHAAGVRSSALQLVPGHGSVVGAALVSDPRINGVCFTGSTATAQAINRAMADHLAPDAPLIAETGGLNAMIVDSTALPEQAIKDVIASAFQSAGQRCSALRILYIQEDVAETFTDRLFGAMDELRLGDPWDFDTDIGPVITPDAQDDIQSYIDRARADGRVMKELDAPRFGTFIAPTVLRVEGIEALEREIFGPVLHLATYKASEFEAVIAAINASGYGLTFGIHSRIDDRIDRAVSQLNVGNLYVNRNQIGAIVGSQPFGGESLSGTGPKAGGPSYVTMFTSSATVGLDAVEAPFASISAVQSALAVAPPVRRRTLDRQDLPGPTGESNALTTYGRGTVLCLGPTLEAAKAQAEIAEGEGCFPVLVAPGAVGPNTVDGVINPDDLIHLEGLDAVVSWAKPMELRGIRRALAARAGALIPLITEADFGRRCRLERHVCVDTTAAGGNAGLLASAS